MTSKSSSCRQSSRSLVWNSQRLALSSPKPVVRCVRFYSTFWEILVRSSRVWLQHFEMLPPDHDSDGTFTEASGVSLCRTPFIQLVVLNSSGLTPFSVCVSLYRRTMFKLFSSELFQVVFNYNLISTYFSFCHT